MYGRTLLCKAQDEASATFGSGAFMYAAVFAAHLMTAGPDGVRGSTPHQRDALVAPKALRAFVDPRSSPVVPSPHFRPPTESPAIGGYAAVCAGERKVSPRIIKAQAIRAILLASAMMTTFGGRRSCKPWIHASPAAARALAKRMALPPT